VVALPFVNADLIAAKRWPHEAAKMSYEAARCAAVERTRLLDARESFITETVFSHPSKLELLREARRQRFLVTLHIVLVPVELSVVRVRSRVRAPSQRRLVPV